MKKFTTRTKKKKTLFARALLKAADALGWKNPEDEGVGKLIEYAKSLISLGADINARYKYKCPCFSECAHRDKRTPLIFAIGHLELVKALLLAGAQVNARTIEGTTALLEAVRYGGTVGVALVQTLLDAGARIETRDKSGTTPLMQAAGMYYHSTDTSPGSLPIIKLLLKAGAKVNKQDHMGKTALMKAVRCRYHPRVAEMLLTAGANPNLQDKRGKTALLYALSSPHIPTIKMLLAAGANINTHDRGGYTALLHTNDVALAQLFIDAGANVNAQTNSGKTALTFNANYCNERTCTQRIAMMELLLKAGADIKKPGYTKVTCVPMINALLAAGADIHAPDRKGDTALIHASKEANATAVQLLIDTGANLNAQARACKWTALMVAASSDNKKDSAVIRAAINASENDELYGDQYGTTAYHVFAQQALADRALADLEVIKLLIKAGADVNKRGSHGETALMIAASRKHYAAPLIEALLAARADRTLKDYKSKTARSYAARDVKPLFCKK